MSDPRIDEAVKRVVAHSVLRRLQRMVRADEAQAATDARWAGRLTIALLLAAVATVLWLAIR